MKSRLEMKSDSLKQPANRQNLLAGLGLVSFYYQSQSESVLHIKSKHRKCQMWSCNRAATKNLE